MTPPRMMQSTTDKQVAGVCGGIAHYLEVDTTLVRILFVLLGLASGIGVALYVILAVIMPTEAEIDADMMGGNISENALDPVLNEKMHASRRRNNTMVLGVIAIVGGIALLAGNLDIGRFVLPAMLILLGLWVIRRER